MITNLVLHPLLVALFDLPRGFWVPIVIVVLLFYGALAAFATAGSIIAVRTRLADLPKSRQTADAMTVLPITAAVATTVTVAFAWAVDFNLHPLILATEAAFPAAAFIGAILVAHRWSLRDHNVHRS